MGPLHIFPFWILTTLEGRYHHYLTMRRLKVRGVTQLVSSRSSAASYSWLSDLWAPEFPTREAATTYLCRSIIFHKDGEEALAQRPAGLSHFSDDMGLLVLDPPGKFHQPTQAPFPRSWLQTRVPTQGKDWSPHHMLLLSSSPPHCWLLSAWHLSIWLPFQSPLGFMDLSSCSHLTISPPLFWYHL